MNETIRQWFRRLILWACPEIARLQPRAEETEDLELSPVQASPQPSPQASPAVPGGHAHGHGARVPGAHVWLLILALGAAVHAAPKPAAKSPRRTPRKTSVAVARRSTAFRGKPTPFAPGLGAAPQGGATRDTGNFQFDPSLNLKVNCVTGCSASSGFTDNSAFTIGGSTINPIGALYTTTAPAITAGNAGRLRMDASSFLEVNCQVGCSGSSFSDNSGFTAGTTAIGITGGWYSTAATNCTSGSACAPQLTADRKLFVQAYQGTSPWTENVSQWGGTALGAPSAYGTSPGAVNVPGVNAFITNTPSVSQGTSPWVDAGSHTPADTYSNPTDALNSFSLLAGFNGTTWDRLRDDSNKYLYVDFAALAGIGLGTPTMYGTGPAGEEVMGVNAYITNTPAVAQSGTWNIGSITGALPAGTNTIGKVDVLGNGGAAFDQAPGSAVPANDVMMGGTDGTNTRTFYVDPCQRAGKSTANINLTASGQIISGSNYTLICSINIISATAQNVALVEGTGTTCGTSTAGMAGGATAATGWNFAANGGLTQGNGAAWIFKTATSGDNVCLLLSGTGQTSGNVTYVQIAQAN